MSSFSNQAKAFVAGVAAALATGVTAYFAGRDEFTVEGFLAAAGAAVVGYAGTYFAPRNAPRVQGRTPSP